jgi:hypothetical protein
VVLLLMSFSNDFGCIVATCTAASCALYLRQAVKNVLAS